MDDMRPRLVHFILFFALFFTNQMDFRGWEFIGGGKIDLQVLIRLGVLWAFAVYFGLHYKIFVRLSSQIPAFMHLLLLAYLAVVSMNPETVNLYSFYALATHITMYFVIVIMVAQFGMNNMVYYYFWGTLVVCLLSMVYYYFIPEIGRYIYWDNGEILVSTRMKGVVGHPNTLGFMTATAALGLIHLYFKGFPASRFSYPALVIVLFCLILTNSRTSLGGLIIMAAMYACFHYRMFVLMSVLAAATVFATIFASEAFSEIFLSFMQMISRSGNVEEITSLTGRSTIWEQMLVLIEMKPVFGWGHGVMGDVLAAHKEEIGFEVAQAHNLYLQIIFSGGFVGFAIFVLSLLAALIPAVFQTYARQSAFEFCIVLFIILNGITETIILASVSNNSYLIFVMCIASLSIYCEQTQKKIPSL